MGSVPILGVTGRGSRPREADYNGASREAKSGPPRRRRGDPRRPVSRLDQGLVFLDTLPETLPGPRTGRLQAAAHPAASPLICRLCFCAELGNTFEGGTLKPGIHL